MPLLQNNLAGETCRREEIFPVTFPSFPASRLYLMNFNNLHFQNRLLGKQKSKSEETEK
jgi:hypothetical protein